MADRRRQSQELILFFVYVDFTEDDGRPFYVGKGTMQRIKASSRNAYHDRVAKKHGMRREVALETPSEFEALNREIRLIAELHTFTGDPHWNGIGTNFTEGGEGGHGWKHSADACARIAKAKQGNRSLSGRKRSPATRGAIAKALTGKKRSDEHQAKINEALRGKRRKPFSSVTREKLSKAASRKRGPLPASVRDKLSKALKTAYAEGRRKRKNDA